MREGPHELVAGLIDPRGKFSAELRLGRVHGQFRPSGDEVGNRFGLGQIDASMQKRAPCELTREGQAGAVFQKGVEDELGRKNAAMAADFDHRFPSESSRGAQHGQQDLIDDLPGALDLAEARL